MLRAFVPALLALLCATDVSALYHRDVTKANFDTLIDPSKAHIMLEFYAPWCGHCKSLAPEYEKLGFTFADSRDVVIAQVDADRHKALASRFGVRGFPTLKWLSKGSTFKQIEDVTAGRTAAELLKFVNEKTGLSEALKKDPDDLVVELNGDDFDEAVVKSGKHAFIGFFAPWCGHCQALKPTWRDLAKLYKEEDNIVIGSVNCDDNKPLCEAHKVEGFPSLKYFAPGSGEGAAYTEERGLEDFAKFLSPKAGLDLSHDGGVLASAGVIDELAEHVQRFMLAESAEERSNVVNVCKEHVEKMGDESVSEKFGYYLKVFKKIGDKGADYIEKERKRLHKIMESADDMESGQKRSFLRRLNVLGAFLAGK